MDQESKERMQRLWQTTIDDFNSTLETGPRKQDGRIQHNEKKKHPNDLFADWVQNLASQTNRLSDPGASFLEGKGLFSSSRHNKGPLDRVRSACGPVFDKTEGAVELGGNLAALAFPPASAISQALLFVLKGFKKVSDALDAIETFFADIQYFFQRLSLIQARLPRENAFGESLVMVFVAILKVCGSARKIAVAGRVKAFFKSFIGDDEGLTDNVKQLANCMSNLESSVLMATLGTVTESKEYFMEQFTKMFEMFPALSIQSQASFQRSTETHRGPFDSEATLPYDRGNQRVNNFNHVVSQLITGAEGPIEQWKNEMARRYVPNTFAWLGGELKPLLTRTGQKLFIYITGSHGTGKTMLAYHIYRSLELSDQSKPRRQYIPLYFTFSNETGKVRSVTDMACYFMLQAAERDVPLKEIIQNKRAEVKNEVDWFLKAFASERNNSRRIVMIVDGIDQLNDTQREKVESMVKRVHNSIIVLTQYQPLFNHGMGGKEEKKEEKREEKHEETRKRKRTEIRTIRLDYNRTESRKEDLKLFARSRVGDMARLGALRQRQRDKIVEYACSSADSFVYVDYALHRLNTNPEMTLQCDPEQSPAGNTAFILDTAFEKCLRVLPQAREHIHCLFTWLACTRSQITLAGAVLMMELVSAESIHANTTESPIRSWLQEPSFSCLIALSARPIEVPSSYDAILDNGRNTIREPDSLIGFSTPSLQTHYRLNAAKLSGIERFKDETSQAVCNGTMFKLISYILTNDYSSGVSSTAARDELISLACNSWPEFLPTSGSPSVTDKLKKIFSDRNGALRRLEICNADLGGPNGPLSILGLGERFIKLRLFQILPSWNIIDGGTVRWDRGFYEFAARMHINSWWSAETPIGAYTSFRYARASLYEMRAYYQMPDDIASLKPNKNLRDILNKKVDISPRGGTTEQEIQHVSEAFDLFCEKCPDACRDTSEECVHATRLRCRAMALRYCRFYGEARADINKALGLREEADAETIRPWKAKLFDRRGRIDFGEWEDPINIHGKTACLKDALKAFESAERCYNTPNNTGNRPQTLATLNQLRAKAVPPDIRRDEWLEYVEKATGRSEGEARQMLIYFEDIISALASTRKWTSIKLLLERVPQQQLATISQSRTHEALHRASKSWESESRRYLDDMYNESAATLQDWMMPVLANSVRVWRAVFHRHMMGRSPEAKNILQTVLDSSGREIDIPTITFASWQLGELLLEDFHPVHGTSQDELLAAKETAQQRVEQLLELIRGRMPGFQPDLSPISIIIALMEIKIGSRRSGYKHAEAIFSACLEALQDDKASNDPPSLQMLAKILTLVPGEGLLKEAQRAAGYQFYIVDHEQYKKEQRARDFKLPISTPIALKDRDASIIVQREREPNDMDYWKIQCGGACGQFVNAQTRKACFLCVYCTDTILCETCHGERGQRRKGWRRQCHQYHERVRFRPDSPIQATRFGAAPFTGFRDIKLSESEREDFSSWLLQLRAKWDAAWLEQAGKITEEEEKEEEDEERD